ILPAGPAVASADDTDLVPWTLSNEHWSNPIYAMLADATTAPSADLSVVVTEVEGQGFIREDENKPWKPATKGMQLTSTAEFRTGPKGSIQFKIMPDQTVSVDRLSTVKILQLVKDGNVVK